MNLFSIFWKQKDWHVAIAKTCFDSPPCEIGKMKMIEATSHMHSHVVIWFSKDPLNPNRHIVKPRWWEYSESIYSFCLHYILIVSLSYSRETFLFVLRFFWSIILFGNLRGKERTKRLFINRPFRPLRLRVRNLVGYVSLSRDLYMLLVCFP